ncbi:acetyltransferase [Colletotrichum musicola]|uniref:Acetyltransferase n=1 Tax=Colletotrichum musicola TaxID=2175873 RepID=A0A8H6N5N7_9PEZI|nr:acetyltransferase [Colletotrichum musicola]
MTTAWKILPCTVADAPALARNNMSAFWTDPNWRIMWPDRTLDFVIAQCAERVPRNLLRDRDTLRHEKAVDPETGALVGYARWVLPAGLAAGPGPAPWADAQIPDVSAEERAAIEKKADAAWWKPVEMEGSDDESIGIRNRILASKPYISTFLFLLPLLSKRLTGLGLDYLAVHPENMGKGIGTELVRSGMRRAEELGVGVFILAFRAGLNVYLRLGFKEVDRVVQDATKWRGEGDYAVYLLTYEVDQTK